MADVSVSLDLDAKQLYNELQQVQSHFASFAAKTTQEGDKAAKGLTHPFDGIAQKISSSLGSVAGALGIGLGVAGIEHAIVSLVEYGTKVEDLSRRYGVASESLQKFGNAAELNGSSLEAVAKAFRFLEVNQEKAIQGNKPMIKAFEALGVSVEDLKTKRPDEIMLQIGHSALGAADTVKVLGKSALELRPTLAGLADGTIKFGHAISDIDTERLKEANDLFQKMGQEVKIVAATVIAELLPAVGKVQAFLAKPAEAITRSFDKTPTGEAAAPEDSALAKQIHESRERAAGTTLADELAPAADISAPKARRDFGEPIDEQPVSPERKQQLTEAIHGADKNDVTPIKLDDTNEILKEIRDNTEDVGANK